MKIKRILLSLQLFICILSVKAQFTTGFTSDALTKYWLYRWRFVNDFVKVGDAQGESLPIGERNMYHDNHNYVKWGDGTQKLGMYICLLATEFKLLENNNRLTDLEKTKTELYYAIKAFERLDCTAEGYPPYSFSGFNMCNGFFLRDDVPADFLDQPAEPWNTQSTSTNRDKLNNLETQFCYTYPNQNTIQEIGSFPPTDFRAYLNGSDFITMQNDPNGDYRNGNMFNEESHDQAICMFQGFGMVVKLIDDVSFSVKLNDGTTIQYNFHDEASDLYEKVLEYIKYETDYFCLPTGQLDWRITNFYGDMVTAPQGGQSGNSIPFSFPMAQAGNMVLGPNSGIALTAPYLGIPAGFHDFISIASKSIWNGFIQGDYSNDPNDHTVNQSMYVQLAAMSDSWRGGGLFNIVNNTPFSIFNHIEEYDWEAFYLPLWSVWNNKPIPMATNLRSKIYNAIYDDISSAPCEGPYRFDVFNFTPQWSGNFKYFRGYDETHYGDGNAVAGYFNGLDYLILHNLFYLMYNGNLPFYHDLIDRVIDYNIPGSPPPNPNSPPHYFAINAFNSITAKNVVQTNSQVDFRAGYDITFKPDFHVRSGADFHAFIDPFTCVNGEYRNEGIQDSTLATAYGFNEKFSFTNHGIIDYSEEESEEEMKLSEEIVDVSLLLFTYPNPCTDKFTYFLNEKTDENILQTVEVYNMLGDKVHSEQVNYTGQNIIDLGEIATGMYIVRVVSGEIVYSTKMMVE